MRLYWPKVPEEFKAEIRGVADGVQARRIVGIDLSDIVGLNGFFDSVSYHCSLKAEEGQVARGEEHCSAFIATGKATKGENIVVAHNSWFSYMYAAGYNVIIGISPTTGNEFLMQALPGTIHSGSDWYINNSGVIVTETTITGMNTFNRQGTPIFVRARKAIQYGNTLDEWVKIMIEGNNGGYASDWLIGDVKTGEIACLELGTFNHRLDRTFNGIFFGSNIAMNEKVRSETVIDYNDRSSSCMARQDRWKQLTKGGREPIDVEDAKRFLADHQDSYSGSNMPNRNSICGHIELDNRGWPEWDEGPYYPAGAHDGKATDSELASKGAFWAHWGHPCDMPFVADSFLTKHPEYNWQKSRLQNIRPYPWTMFETYPKWTTKD